MVITRQILATQLSEYLQHKSTIEQLVDWSERAVMDGDFEPAADHDTLRDITARIGLADVRAFGLTWEDCEGCTESGVNVRQQLHRPEVAARCCGLPSALSAQPPRDLIHIELCLHVLLASRHARRPAGNAREVRIPSVFERRATPRGGMHRAPNATGLPGRDTSSAFHASRRNSTRDSHGDAPVRQDSGVRGEVLDCESVRRPERVIRSQTGALD